MVSDDKRELTLSPEQLQAVEARDRFLLVIAPAGSGKTELLARRLERIVGEAEEDGPRVLAVSYTAKAAEVLRVRLRRRLGSRHQRVQADTVHGFCLDLVRRYGTRIGLPVEPELLLREDDRIEYLHDWLEQSAEEPPADFKAAFANIDLYRARGLNRGLVDSWNAALRARGALDYPAMLDRALELLEDAWVLRQIRRLYGHLAIDEAQNLTPAQYSLVKAILGTPGTATMSATLVGDERQSIVGFAGADAGLMSQFARDYSATRLELRVNYRSARSIVALCDRIAEGLDLPVRTSTQLSYPAAGLVTLSAHQTEEAEGLAVAHWVKALLKDGIPASALAIGEERKVAPEEIAVLARSAAALRRTREALLLANLEVATASTEDDWVASTPARLLVELLSYRTAPSHKSSRAAIFRILGLDESEQHISAAAMYAGHESRTIIEAALEAADVADIMSQLGSFGIDDEDWVSDRDLLLHTWQEFCESSPRGEWTFGNFRQFIAKSQREDRLSPGVRVLTVHRAQGREFRAVALVALNDGQFPDFRATSPKQELDELRVFYVACSRASRMLSINRAMLRSTYYGSRSTEPSRFLRYLRS